MEQLAGITLHLMYLSVDSWRRNVHQVSPEFTQQAQNGISTWNPRNRRSESGQIVIIYKYIIITTTFKRDSAVNFDAIFKQFYNIIRPSVFDFRHHFAVRAICDAGDWFDDRCYCHHCRLQVNTTHPDIVRNIVRGL